MVKRPPRLVVLNFSGGKQSSCLLWMVLLGKVERPKNFLVLNADPGMENSGTYKYVQLMFDECKRVGIEAYTVPGPNLYSDLISLSSTNNTRIDNPPYWTKDRETGKRGRLIQKCTQHYKIQPMDQFLRRYLYDKFVIPKYTTILRPGLVEKWIGFTYSELERVKPSQRVYINFRYPLIEMKMNNEDVISFFVENNLPIPPRSVCNACFANGLITLKDMYQNRSSDWEQAVAVDEAVRDLRQVGVRDEVYVSNTLIPLEILAEKDFDVTKIAGDLENGYSCDSGYCFL